MFPAAPFPLELAIRLVRMFSFVGETVYNPFPGHRNNDVGRLLSDRKWPVSISGEKLSSRAALSRVMPFSGDDTIFSIFQ